MANEQDLSNVDKVKHGKMLEFLQSIKSVEIAGKNVIQLPDGEFAEYVLMEEEYFVNNWLSQFAIGFVNGVNYFDQEGWYRLTDAFTKGVIVLNEDKEPVLLIRKFTDIDMSANNRSYLEYHVNKIGANAKFNPNKAEVDTALNTLTEIIQKLTEQNEDYDTLTMMIPWEYYISKGVNFYIMKQLVYIRDNFSYQGVPVKGNDDLLIQIEDILKRNALKQPVYTKEKELIAEITGNTFIFYDGEYLVETKNSSSASQKDIDPLVD